MFEQAQKQFQAMFTPAAWSEQASSAMAKSQAYFAQVASDAQELAKIEMENLSQLAQSRRPEEFMAVAGAAFSKRQAFFTARLALIGERAKQAQDQWTQAVEGKASEASAQASQAVEAAFGGAKQGLDMAESAVKSAVSRAGKASGKR